MAGPPGLDPPPCPPTKTGFLTPPSWVWTYCRNRSSHHPVYSTFKFQSPTEPELVEKGTWREREHIYFPDYFPRLAEVVDNAFALRKPLPTELRFISILETIESQIQLDSK
jgi:hypothetical protein